MKKIAFLLFSFFLFSCGSSEEKKKGFEYNRTQKEEKKSSGSSDSAVPIDLDNKGIGPITAVDFSAPINQDMVTEGENAFKQK
ncbi:MAG: cytochrome c, partial [Flavobacteriaceae bacterium]